MHVCDFQSCPTARVEHSTRLEASTHKRDGHVIRVHNQQCHVKLQLQVLGWFTKAVLYARAIAPGPDTPTG